MNRVVGSFSFQKMLLGSDTFEAHITELVKKSLRGNDNRCTNTHGVFWNTSFKGWITLFHYEWLASGVNYYT